MTGLLFVVPVLAVIVAVIAWKRRSPLVAVAALFVLAVAVWPWAATHERGKADSAAIERARDRALAAVGAEADARRQYEVAEAAVAEWHRIKGPEDPTALRVAADSEMADLDRQRSSGDPEVARAAQLQFAVVQQRRFDLASAELRLGELTVTREDAAHALAGAEVVTESVGAAVAEGPVVASSAPAAATIRRGIALGLGALGAVALGSFTRQRARSRRTAPTAWPSIFATGSSSPRIIDRTAAPDAERTVDLTREEARPRAPITRPGASVSGSAAHVTRRRRRHN